MRKYGSVVILAAAALAAGACGANEDSVEPDFDADPDASDVEGGEASTDGASDALDSATDSVAAADGDAETGCGWTVLRDGLKGGTVNDVLFDPRAPTVAYAVSGAAIYRSSDGGGTWKLQGHASAPIAQLAFPPGPLGNLLATSSDGLLQSSDAGASWTTKSLSGLRLLAILLHPAAPQRVFVSVRGSGILRSSDGGATWSSASSGLPVADITALVGDPDDANSVHAAAIHLNDAGGYSSSGAILRTTSGGTKWASVFSGKDVRNLRGCASNPDVLLASTGAGLVKSSDRGATWASAGLVGTYIGDAIASPKDCSVVFASAPFEGLRRSTDGGTTFGPLLTELPGTKPDLGPSRIAIDPASTDRIIVAMNDGAYVSADAGASWSSVDTVFSFAMRQLATRGQDLWLATWGTGVWRRPAGEGWQRISTTEVPFSRAFSVAASPGAGTVFVGGWPELWKSSDATHFTSAGFSGNVMAVGFDPAEPEKNVYVASQVKGVVRSLDGGKTWTPINGGLTAWSTPAGNFIDVRTILVHPNGSTDLVIGTNGKGVFWSDDDGASWHAAGGLMANKSVTCMIPLDAPSGKVLIACVEDLGIARSADGGRSWTASNEGLPKLSVNGIVYDVAAGALYAATASGVARSTTAGLSWEPFDSTCIADPVSSPVLVQSATERRLYILSARGVEGRTL